MEQGRLKRFAIIIVRAFNALLIFSFPAFVMSAPNVHANNSALRTAELRVGKGVKWVENEVVVKFDKSIDAEQIERIKDRHSVSEFYSSKGGRFKRLRVPAGKTAKETAGSLEAEPGVEYAELNYYAYALFVPNDPYYSFQWNLNDPQADINVEAAWDISTGEPDVIVAVLDTGVAYEDYRNFHQGPDLANTNFVGGYDFVNNDSHPNDDDGHGTHVTGTIAQSTHNSLGAAGVAFDCSIMPVKVLNRRGEAPYTTIAEGVYFAVDNGADVINLSLGGPSDSITLREAVAYAYSHGVTVICSAGNEYEVSNPPSYPAAYDLYCIAVGATRYDLTRAYYSNTGSYVDVVAPGGDLNVDQNGDGYGDGILQETFDGKPSDFGYWFYTGTSMAAPHVSGIAALLVSTGINDPDEIRDAIEGTAIDLGPVGLDQEYGWGIVDAYAALNYFNVPGDFTGDGLVDCDDLAILANNWLSSEPSVDISPSPSGDGIVNLLDLAVVVSNWDGCNPILP